MTPHSIWFCCQRKRYSSGEENKKPACYGAGFFKIMSVAHYKAAEPFFVSVK